MYSIPQTYEPVPPIANHVFGFKWTDITPEIHDFCEPHTQTIVLVPAVSPFSPGEFDDNIMSYQWNN